MGDLGDSLGDPFLELKNEDSKPSNLGALISRNVAGRRFLVESKKLWRIAGPAIFTRLALYGMNVVSQAFVGHLGDLELAVISTCTTVIIGFNYGLFLGMGSALETLCGQAYGAGQYHMLGVYLQRSWIVLFAFGVLLLPIYIYATPILKLLGQSDEVAELSGSVSIWFIPVQFAFVLLFPLQIYLQSQLKNMVIAWLAAATLLLHIVLSWSFIIKLNMGLMGAAITLDLAWWLCATGQLLYVTCGGCPQTWAGLSRNAFSDLWSFVKLSLASGVMLCLENWYYRILLLLTGNLPDPELAIDSLSVCLNINGLEIMIPIGFLAATGVRVANELGAGNSRAAKFSVIVSASTSGAIGVAFWVLILVFRGELALVFTSSSIIRDAVSQLAILLSFTVLLNSFQPVLSGVAVGSGWQSYVAWINIGCYYVIGIPLGLLLGWVFNLKVIGLWTGMICGTAVQTLILAYITYRCDWEREAAKATGSVNILSSNHHTQEPRIEGGESGFQPREDQA